MSCMGRGMKLRLQWVTLRLGGPLIAQGSEQVLAARLGGCVHVSSASRCCFLLIPVAWGQFPASPSPITLATPMETVPVLRFQMNNYLTVPAHKLDSPTMSRARIGSGRWD